MAEDVKSPQTARQLYTPQSVQNRVVEQHLGGASNRGIASAEGIDRETVARILSQRELVEMRAEQQSLLERLGFKAIAVYEKALDSPELPIAAATATKILEGLGVLDKRGLQGTIEDSIDRERMHHTYKLREFQQGPDEFKRRKPRSVRLKTELQVVPDGRTSD